MPHVLIVGAGGNIGSHLVPHLARTAGIERVTLIDRDVYEPRNLEGQDITRADVGRRKAAVQATRLRRINASLEVRAIGGAVEDVPLGRLRADVIIAALDSRRSRQYVNWAAWRLGVPWIDTGVEPGGWLARVNVYMPGDGQPCLECAWDDRDYAALEQTYPCGAEAPAPAPTRAPSALGALAASLAALECGKLLDGQPAPAAVGRQVLIDAAWHAHYVTTMRRRPSCRLGDHAPWRIRELRADTRRLTLEGLWRAATKARRPDAASEIRVEGQRAAMRTRCARCGVVRDRASIARVWRRRPVRCPRCGGELTSAGFDLAESIAIGALPATIRRLPLRRLGILNGDVVTLTSAAGPMHLVIDGDSR